MSGFIVQTMSFFGDDAHDLNTPTLTLTQEHENLIVFVELKGLSGFIVRQCVMLR